MKIETVYHRVSLIAWRVGYRDEEGLHGVLVTRRVVGGPLVQTSNRELNTL